MKYAKPELVVLGSPTAIILNHTQKPFSSSDNCTEPATATAYEADE
jgi:hypothetical protein